MIDGTFSVKARGYTYVYLYFSKEGYYQEKLDLSCDDEDDPFSPGYKSDRKLDCRDIRMVLEKKGDITTLIEEDFKLIYRRQEDGTASGRVADLDRKKWELFPDDRYLYSIAVTNLLDPEFIPPMCVYMMPKIDGDGRVLSEDKAGADWGRPFLLPQEMSLITSDPEGGFIVYEQEQDEQAFWSMKLAPETGYKQEIVLDANRLFRYSPMVRNMANAGIYFYFRINDRYGKGRLRIPTFPEGDYALEMKTEFKLQADGTRNLDTGRR